jgi:hypothetical protein
VIRIQVSPTHVSVEGQEIAVYIMNDVVVEADKAFFRLCRGLLRDHRQPTPTLIMLNGLWVKLVTIPKLHEPPFNAAKRSWF